jgi:hypothetical protein
MKCKVVTSVMVLALLAAGAGESQVTENAVILEQVIGPYFGPDSMWVNCGNELVFQFRIEMKEDVRRLNTFCGGFQVYSPNGATWGAVTPSFIHPDWSTANFPIIEATPVGSLSGSGGDTVRFVGSGILGGLSVPPGGYSQVAWQISVTLESDPGLDGMTLCVDSVYNASSPPGMPSYDWRWQGDAANYPPSGIILPTFSEGRCYTLVWAPLFNCGNVNCDVGFNIDLSDLIYFVDFLFGGGPAPIITSWADMNCDSELDLSDLIYLVNYLFNGGPAPCANC